MASYLVNGCFQDVCPIHYGKEMRSVISLIFMRVGSLTY